MKKQLLVPIFLLLSLVAQAQIKIDTLKTIKRGVSGSVIPIKNIIKPNTTPSNGTAVPTIQKDDIPSTEPAQPTLTDADYSLAVVTTTIKTGRDNKEYPSRIMMRLLCNSKSWRSGFVLDYSNELAVNSTMPLIISQMSSYNASANSLNEYKQHGLLFVIKYWPNIVLDAWKIESLSLTLEFKDKNGNPHPTMGRKTITFNDSSLWMDGFDKQVIVYETDKYFNPLPVTQCKRENYIQGLQD